LLSHSWLRFIRSLRFIFIYMTLYGSISHTYSREVRVWLTLSASAICRAPSAPILLSSQADMKVISISISFRYLKINIEFNRYSRSITLHCIAFLVFRWSKTWSMDIISYDRVVWIDEVRSSKVNQSIKQASKHRLRSNPVMTMTMTIQWQWP